MDQTARLKQVGLFTDLSDEDLGRLCRDVTEVELVPGQQLFAEGEPGDRAYVVVDGALEVVKATEGRDVLIALRGPGSVIGEMALLRAGPRMATVRAREATRLLAISKQTLDGLLASSPTAMRAMFRSLIERMRETSEQLRHSEHMAQLGTLTAGVAHELNNPASAVRRGAQRLDGALEQYTGLLLETPGGPEVARRVLAHARPGIRRAAPDDALARADLEDELETWLQDRGVEEPWALSGELADAGVTTADLEQLGLTGAELAHGARLVAAATGLASLAGEVEEGARRLSDIVRALKGYAYLDRGAVQDVDVVAGIEDTLVLLAHKTRGVRIERDFEPGLPTITALGSELNQVWTNLIDNACDAVAGIADRTPTVVLRTRREGDDVVVEVEDNGPGVPEEHREKIFDAFFTTKPPGQGTGLGLQISHRIVTLEHAGELAVESEPGRTIFRVVLPIAGPPETGSDPGQSDQAHVQDTRSPP